MNAESLAVSACINIGLAFLILTLFSILRKQPSNAPIYYARRLSQHRRVSFNSRFAFWRLLPSIGWIRRALAVTEEEILDTCGLDVLIFIRLFKFGHKHCTSFDHFFTILNLQESAFQSHHIQRPTHLC
ncbi:hypothetical protein CDL12_18022 [Handroanthus impetiginosus]|uniref:CSC1/OSCA1-like N-terminal transmembrane domain-containing protein n=1 Tax=Handroanthus impetiginosus TaxID=429701 RepID=A0A2G9GVT2_9LAMI|nr:hypothetical protein CDL12_18022 [Handroanthus impetiginosus]